MASVTNTYARAFADAVFDGHHDPDKTLHEAQAVAELVAGSRELRAVWEAPSITAEQKRAVLDAIVARQGISRTVRNFVAVLIDHRRITFLGPIVKQSEQELNQRMGFTEAEITSARPLNDQDRAELEAQVAKLAGGRVRATYLQDATLLGGAVVRIGSTVYDGSIRAQLQQLKQKLVNA